MRQLANIFKTATIAAVAMAMTACVTNNTEGPFDEPQQIGYDAVVGLSSTAANSRAIITDLVYPNTIPFAAFATQLGDGKNWATNKDESILLINGDAVAYDTYLTGKWTTQTPYYWPDFGSVSFFAYSPWADNNGNKISNISFTCETGELKVSAWDVNDAKYKGIDLMIADPKYDLTSVLAPSGVPTAFRHKLALVSFRAGLIGEYTEDGITYQILVRKISLKNVYTQGSYSTTTDAGRWTDLGGKEEMVIYNDPTGLVMSHDEATSLGDNVLVMPQGHIDNASGAQLEIIYFDTKSGSETTLTISLRNKIPTSTWAINNHYSYVIMFDRGDPDYIEFAPPTISTDWSDGGSYILTVE